jgi:hypothetical protein
MGILERKARDARVKEHKKRQTIFTSSPYQKFMIHGIKAPLLKLLNLFAERFPEPTKENTWCPNSHTLIDIRDEFFRWCHLDKRRNRVLRAIINFVIVMYDYDPPYRMMIDWWVEQIEAKKWRHDVPIKVTDYKPFWWHKETTE